MKKTNLVKQSIIFFTVCLSLFTLCSCYKVEGDCCPGENIIGSGTVIEEIRNVGSFNKVDIMCACKLFFRKEAAQNIRIVGEDNILSIIEMRVENDTLVIESEQSYSTNLDIKVYISMEAVKGFTIFGAASIFSEEDFTTDSLNLEIKGAGKIELGVAAQAISTHIMGAGSISLWGSAEYHSIEFEGAGDVDAYDLEVKKYDINIIGAGNCRIFVTEELNVEISGAGSVYYRGNPTIINSTISGIGKLVKL